MLVSGGEGGARGSDMCSCFTAPPSTSPPWPQHQHHRHYQWQHLYQREHEFSININMKINININIIDVCNHTIQCHWCHQDFLIYCSR